MSHTAEDLVGTILTPQPIVSVLTEKKVAAVAPEDEVVPLTAFETVISAEAKDGVVAFERRRPVECDPETEVRCAIMINRHEIWIRRSNDARHAKPLLQQDWDHHR
ncbi:MAG: hypothetical protein U1E45_18580 [Geminicoccaceae bacterium]